jgi:hypothetical protein
MGRFIQLVLALSLTLAAQPAKNPELKEIEDVAGLPRVLLIGDSISMGYTIPVRELLKGKANVHRVLTNGGPTINGMEHLAEWLGSGKWDVIHFNWGLHDLKVDKDGARQVPIDKYEQNLRELVTRMRQTGARLIWASTTPVPDAKVNPVRVSSDVIAYNKVAAKVMQEAGIPTDDLYSFALPKLGTIQLPANVHYTPEGYNALAEQVAASIAQALARK